MTSEASVLEQPSGTHPALLLVPALLALSLVPIALLPDRDAARLATQLFVVVLLVLAGVDFVTLRVPNLLVYPAIAFALAATAIVEPRLLVSAGALDSAVIGGLATLGIMFAVAVVGRGAMGMGDVKLACFVGCALGLRGGIIGMMFGFALGAAVALPLMLLRLRKRKDVLPLTPFLAAGAIAYIVLFGSLLTRGHA